MDMLRNLSLLKGWQTCLMHLLMPVSELFVVFYTDSYQFEIRIMVKTYKQVT